MEEPVLGMPRSIDSVTQDLAQVITMYFASTRYPNILAAKIQNKISKHFQPPLYSLPKFKTFHCKMQFFVKKSPICCSRSFRTVAHRIGNIGSANPTVKSVSPNNKGFHNFGLSQLKKVLLYFRNK